MKEPETTEEAIIQKLQGMRKPYLVEAFALARTMDEPPPYLGPALSKISDAINKAEDLLLGIESEV